MAKLYVFGIGGTGARVIKAFTFLLASGVKLENFQTVVPILIDPDIGNGDLNRTREILRLYHEIRNHIKDPDDFFGTEIKTVGELSKTKEDKIETPLVDFEFKLDGINSTFKDYIGYSTLDEGEKVFISSLYAKRELDDDLNVGFKGRPNMGVIVLSQFKNKEVFDQFVASFDEGDAIFIINSIFGGTGAAGFPLLLKTLRGLQGGDKAAKVRESFIGALTMLPYFQLEREEKESERAIKDLSFDEKAKIAMDYYLRTIIDTKQIQTIYFLGNRSGKSVEKYAEGEKAQQNRANFLELAGALAIFDFCKHFPGYSENNAGKIKEFGIERDEQPLTFDSLNEEDKKLIMLPLSKYRFFVCFLNKALDRALQWSRWTKIVIEKNYIIYSKRQISPLNESYFKSGEYNNMLKKFNDHFNDWLFEMQESKPSFSPFNESEVDRPFELIKKRPKVSFEELDIQNCLRIDEVERTDEKKHTTLIKLFQRTTEEVIKPKL